MKNTEEQLDQLMKFAYEALKGTMADREKLAGKLKQLQDQIDQLGTVTTNIPTLVHDRVDGAVLKAAQECPKEFEEVMKSTTESARTSAEAYRASLKELKYYPAWVIGVSALFALGIGIFLYNWLPSVETLRDRRDQLAALEQQIADLQIQATNCLLSDGKKRLCFQADLAFKQSEFGKERGEWWVIPKRAK